MALDMALDFERLARQKKLRPFIYDDNWFRFFGENIDMIELADFAKASQDDLNQIKSIIPQHSYLHIKIKRVYDKKYYWDKCPRGSYYPFLMRVCSGFRNVFNDCK